MARLAYRRVSSVDQSLERQEFGNDIDKIFEEKLSGNTKSREI